MFLDYTVQSKAEDNRISFFVKIENLSRALKSCCSTKTESPVQARCEPNASAAASTPAGRGVSELHAHQGQRADCAPTPVALTRVSQVKLTKKQGQAVLSFEIHESACTVLHEVPIRIVSDPRETMQYTDPPIGEESDQLVAVVFPSKEFRGLKNVVSGPCASARTQCCTSPAQSVRPSRARCAPPLACVRALAVSSRERA